MGLSSQRPFPKMAQRSLQTQWKRNSKKTQSALYKEDILFLSDAFTEYFQPHIGLTAINVLTSLGCKIHFVRVLGAGRTLISKGFLGAAEKHGKRLLEEIHRLDPDGAMPIVGVEPSEIYTLRDEYLDLFSDDKRMKGIADRTFMLEEFLMRPNSGGKQRCTTLAFSNDPPSEDIVIFHGHCYQKAQPPAEDGYPNGVAASVGLLKMAGYKVQVLEDGCCGMAGAFGYEKEHFNFSMLIAEQTLLPSIRNSLKSNSSILLCTPGVSCHAQIQDGSGIEPYHPIELIAKRL